MHLRKQTSTTFKVIQYLYTRFGYDIKGLERSFKRDQDAWYITKLGSLKQAYSRLAAEDDRHTVSNGKMTLSSQQKAVDLAQAGVC